MSDTEGLNEKLDFDDDEKSTTEPKLSKSKEKKLRKKAAKNFMPKSEHGFMYIGHLPHGFYENEIRAYFSQFGRVVKLRLARSAKTGNHKGYGFIEFESQVVAEIAAETMNNYLMFNKILKCHVIPREKLHKFTFKNAKKPLYIKIKSRFRRKFNAKKSDQSLEKFKSKQEKKLKKKETLLKEYGISLDLSNMIKKADQNKETESKVENVEKVSKAEESSAAKTLKRKNIQVEKKKHKKTFQKHRKLKKC